jgi:hypothetical protein
VPRQVIRHIFYGAFRIFLVAGRCPQRPQTAKPTPDLERGSTNCYEFYSFWLSITTG